MTIILWLTACTVLVLYYFCTGAYFWVVVACVVVVVATGTVTRLTLRTGCVLVQRLLSAAIHQSHLVIFCTWNMSSWTSVIIYHVFCHNSGSSVYWVKYTGGSVMSLLHVVATPVPMWLWCDHDGDDMSMIKQWLMFYCENLVLFSSSIIYFFFSDFILKFTDWVSVKLNQELFTMARGYTEDPENGGYRPSRPTRRAESQRGYADPDARGQRNYADLEARGYTAHYAESPVIQQPDQPQPRTLPRRASRSRNSTLPRSEAARSASRASRPGPNSAVSKVTRSRSWGARPAGVVVYNRHGEPVETNQGPVPPSKPPSTIGVGYRPNTALR